MIQNAASVSVHVTGEDEGGPESGLAPVAGWWRGYLHPSAWEWCGLRVDPSREIRRQSPVAQYAKLRLAQSLQSRHLFLTHIFMK